MSELGFKQITVLNWQEQDEVLSVFVKLSRIDGSVAPMTEEDWIPPFLEPKLNEAVPIEIVRLFEVARGTLIYGYFFYPLFTLGIEQLSRVAEAAIRYKCHQLGASKADSKTFEKGIAFLIAQGIITNPDDWENIRKWRNWSSHPNEQSQLSPGLALDVFRNIAKEISSLFP